MKHYTDTELLEAIMASVDSARLKMMFSLIEVPAEVKQALLSRMIRFEAERRM